MPDKQTIILLFVFLFLLMRALFADENQRGADI
jgi:hypothetical protein